MSSGFARPQKKIQKGGQSRREISKLVEDQFQPSSVRHLFTSYLKDRLSLAR